MAEAEENSRKHRDTKNSTYLIAFFLPLFGDELCIQRHYEIIVKALRIWHNKTRIVVFHSHEVCSPNNRIYHPGHPAFGKFHLATILQDCDRVDEQRNEQRKHQDKLVPPQKRSIFQPWIFRVKLSVWGRVQCVFYLNFIRRTMKFQFLFLGPSTVDGQDPANHLRGFKKKTLQKNRIFTITSGARRILAIKSTLPDCISSFISSSAFWRRGTWNFSCVTIKIWSHGSWSSPFLQDHGGW